MPLKRSLCCALALVLVLPAQAIVGGTDTSAFGQVGRGVQVTPNWVITARHLNYAIGDPFSDAFGSALVAATYQMPGPQLQDDLQLLRLATPISAPALSINTTVLPAGAGYDIAATIVTDLNQTPRGFARTAVREFMPMADPDDDGPLGVVRVNFLVTWLDGYGPPYVEGGDSGGGLFLGHASDATVPLWGITSAQLYDPDDQGQPVSYRSAFVQLANYRDWIDTTMSSDPADAQAISWVATALPVPEPATAGLLVLGLLGLLARKSRGSLE